MKKKVRETMNLRVRFGKEKINPVQMGYLLGGGSDGGEPGSTPWDEG
jgi:hypothetical protein